MVVRVRVLPIRPKRARSQNSPTTAPTRYEIAVERASPGITHFGSNEALTSSSGTRTATITPLMIVGVRPSLTA